MEKQINNKAVLNYAITAASPNLVLLGASLGGVTLSLTERKNLNKFLSNYAKIYDKDIKVINKFREANFRPSPRTVHVIKSKGISGKAWKQPRIIMASNPSTAAHEIGHLNIPAQSHGFIKSLIEEFKASREAHNILKRTMGKKKALKGAISNTAAFLTHTWPITVPVTGAIGVGLSYKKMKKDSK